MKFSKLFWDVYQNEDGHPYVLEKTSETVGVMKLAFPGKSKGDPGLLQLLDEAYSFLVEYRDSNPFEGMGGYEDHGDQLDGLIAKIEATVPSIQQWKEEQAEEDTLDNQPEEPV